MAAELLDLLTRPRYSLAESDRLAAATRGTSKRWLAGYTYGTYEKGLQRRPPVTPHGAPTGPVSFVDLLEVVAISGLRQHGFSLLQVRQIVRNCQEMLGVDRPLASLKFRTGGHDIFVEISDHLLEVGRRKRQLAWNEVLDPFLANLDYAPEIELARRWWPLGHDVPIVLDPEYGFGLPVVRGSGVRTEIIFERFRAGDSPDAIAKDFGIQPIDVERALQFELKRAA